MEKHDPKKKRQDADGEPRAPLRLKSRLAGAFAMGLSMRLRLFVFFMLLVATMLVGVVSILLMTGIFSAGVAENQKLIENELTHMSRNMEKQYGEISAQALRLARHLSRNIEHRLSEKYLTVEDLRNRTEILEEVLDGEYDTLFFSLEKVKTSGVFVILNATVGKREQDARASRAGLFIKNWEPNVLSETSTAILLLRGFSRIGRRHDLVLDAQWAMEFDIEDAPYYSLPQKVARENPEFLSRLYRWQPATSLKGSSYRGMLCSVPLVDSNGTVFGVCGFEVSDMLFRLNWMPAANVYSNLFCALAPMAGQTLDMSGALLSWRYILENEPQSGRELHFSRSEKGFSTYAQRNGEVFMGMHAPISLYAKDSPFYEQRFVLAFLAPRVDIEASISGRNRELLSFSLFLLAMGTAFSFVFSKWYIRPVLNGLDTIRSGMSGTQKPEKTPRTRIPEIDDLIEYLYSQPEEPGQAGDGRSETHAPIPEELPEGGFEAFIENTGTLTRAEENVFNLYLEGHSAKEIAEMLNLSINTIKTHNRRIFMKLQVSSRKELQAYVRMLQKAGRSIK